MQIFWVSGSVGRIRRLNLNFKNLVLAVGGLATLLIALGVILQLVGFRMAVEYNPQLARQLGNLHTAVEMENLQHFYRGRLVEISSQMEVNARYIKQLELANQKLLAIATPSSIAGTGPSLKNAGGPYLHYSAPNVAMRQSGGLLDHLKGMLEELQSGNQRLAQAIRALNVHIQWLERIPTAHPLKMQVPISSGFGLRLDPIRRTPNEHQGTDFQAGMGAIIYSAGAGIVDRIVRDPNYGLMLHILHADGYVTRYAHASEVLVSEGAVVGRLTPIAKVGNSGRTTGPHLHFEIIKNGLPLDPSDWLIGLRQ